MILLNNICLFAIKPKTAIEDTTLEMISVESLQQKRNSTTISKQIMRCPEEKYLKIESTKLLTIAKVSQKWLTIVKVSQKWVTIAKVS